MSLDIIVNDEEVRPAQVGSLARSSSSTSSTPARQHHHCQQHNLHTSSSNHSNLSAVETRRYQYVPYSASQPSSVHSAFGSQTSLPSQPVSRAGRSQYVDFTSQGITMQRLNRGQQHNMPASRSPQKSPPNRRSGLEMGIDQRQHVLNHSAHYHSSQGKQRYTIAIAERQARSSSLKASSRHMVDHYAEFSDAHHQFNNHATAYRGSSSSSENSPQGSPHHSSSPQVLARTGHPRSRHLQHARQQDNIQEDLHEMQPRGGRHSSGKQLTEAPDSPYRSSSRNTFAVTGVPCRVSSNDSFSFASSIKCCVGMQPKKKKKASRRALAFHHQHPQQTIKERERLTNGTSDNWVSLAAVRSQYSAYRNSTSQSTVSCPYIVQSPPARNGGHTSKHSSGYVSEMESTPSLLMGGGFESESDMSDSEFARTAGSRGKPANTVMMKLAKKFSKKNLPISRDDEDGSSIGGDSLGKGEGTSEMKHRSNSVSNLESEGYVLICLSGSKVSNLQAKVVSSFVLKN